MYRFHYIAVADLKKKKNTQLCGDSVGNEVAEFFCMLNIIFSAECTLIKQWISTCCIRAHSLGLLNRVALHILNNALEMQLF